MSKSRSSQNTRRAAGPKLGSLAWVRRTLYLLGFVLLGLAFYFYFSRPGPRSVPPASPPPAWTGTNGFADGMGVTALFNQPQGIAVDCLGNLYVADAYNDLIRRITKENLVTTLAGSAGVTGTANGKGTAARFYSPSGIAVDRLGNLYVADTLNQLIRKINPSGFVTTLAGSGLRGSENGNGKEASFNDPTGVAVDPSGNIYVADKGNNLIRKITVDGRVSTWAGSGLEGHANGRGIDASFASPIGVAVDQTGNVYVADEVSEQVRKIDAEGEVTTLAGTAGRSGSADGRGQDALFCYPGGIAVNPSGSLFITDRGTCLIRKMTAGGRVSTLAGSGSAGFADGSGSNALFHHPSGVAVDMQGNVYIADQGNSMIREMTPEGVVTTFAGGGLARPTAGTGKMQGEGNKP